MISTLLYIIFKVFHFVFWMHTLWSFATHLSSLSWTFIVDFQYLTYKKKKRKEHDFLKKIDNPFNDKKNLPILLRHGQISLWHVYLHYSTIFMFYWLCIGNTFTFFWYYCNTCLAEKHLKINLFFMKMIMHLCL